MIDKEGIWENYILFDEDVHIIEYISNEVNVDNKNVLFILGKGFDPRLSKVLEIIKKSNLKEAFTHCLLLEYDTIGDTDKVTIDKNYQEILNLFNERIEILNLNPGNDEGSLRNSTNFLKSFNLTEKFQQYDTIIIDITALPRALYMILIKKSIEIYKEYKMKKNLFVLVAENSIVDKHIQTININDQPEYLPGFNAGLTQYNTESNNIIWLPVLAENKKKQISALIDFVKPIETVPVLPFPSVLTKNADNLMIEYNDQFFSNLSARGDGVIDRISSGNERILYVHERNPFQVYRKIRNLCYYYQKTLKPLGKSTKLIISCFSSKLVTVGVILAVVDSIDMKTNQESIAVTSFIDRKYRMEKNLNETITETETTAYLIWVCGDLYDLV